MTHTELVERARRWVRSRRYPVVLADVRTTVTSEQPDVIGFRTGGDTMLVECKASRADFLRDRKKFFRREPGMGMGYFRWFFAPESVSLAEAPEGWGLASPRGRSIVVRRNAQPFVKRNLGEEARLLVRAVRCVTEDWGLRMFGPSAPMCLCGHAMHNGRRCGELITQGSKQPGVFGTSVASCGCKGMPHFQRVRGAS